MRRTHRRRPPSAATITKAGYPTISVSQTVTLNANERREIVFDPAAYPQLHVSSPALWWPYQFGSPELYQLAMSADSGGTTSDTKSINFGIRQFTDYRTTVNGTSFAGYKVNGQNIFFRGGGYVWDLLQRWDTRTNTAHMQYVKDMGLNTIRLEGTLGNEELYDLADKAGVMIMPGFVCCSTWESDANWNAEQQQVANASLDSSDAGAAGSREPVRLGLRERPTSERRPPGHVQEHGDGAALAEPDARQRRHLGERERRA